MGEEQSVTNEPQNLVVVGSSAGGVEALSTLVSTLSPDFPAPMVLAQHLDPSRPSNLDLILQKRTDLPVEVVTSSRLLRPGRIYVVPSNHHISVRGHEVEVLEDRQKRPRPSVDTLLSSAAAAYGEHLIAVILTGSGSDGAVGAIDVKNAGGTVIAQDPQTARYPSMPLSLPPTIIDFEVPVEQIGSLLYELLTGVNIPQTEEKTEGVLRQILEQVSRQASIDFRQYKTATILRRIGRRMAVTHQPSIREYAAYLKATPQEVGELVEAFLINVTQFFRDPEAFVYLKNDILPQLIARGRESNHNLRFWAAGCATGEEPYSLAMLLTDLLGAELPEWSVKIFATDLDEAAINFSRRGLYSENLLKGVPDDYRERFFERVDHSYRISKTLRQMVIFGQQDLSRSAPFPRIDMVICRNVLIYFTPELQDYVLNQFAFSLSPHGYLFLGKAETVRPTQGFFELVNKHWKVYRCTGNALPALRRQSFANLDTPHLEDHLMNRPHKNAGKQNADQELPASSLELGLLRRFNELLLRFLPVGIVVIDRAYHILTANGASRRLLGLRDIGTEQDFLHAVRGIPYHEIRAAIDGVFRERNSLNLPEVSLDASSGGNGRYINLSIALMQLEGTMPELAVISIFEVTQQVQMRRQMETVQKEQAQLMSELSTTNKRLSDVNKDIIDTNEELQVANEELMLTHEELQASIEEFETTNEELQATNEELETNNEELQATNEELETTNDELRARTSELQELTVILGDERKSLAEIVELAPFYIMVLRGPSLTVDAYNPRYAQLLENRVVRGRPLDEVIDLFWENGIEVVHLARDAYRLNQVRVTPRTLKHIPKSQKKQEHGPENYFTYTIIPSHDALGKVTGVIIYAADATELRLQEVGEERKHLKLIFDNFSLAALALYDAATTTLIVGSPHYLELASKAHNLPMESLVDRKWQEVAFVTPPERASQFWNTVVEKQEPIHIPELSYRFGDESAERIWDYTITPLMDSEQARAVRYVLISAIEITRSVQARKELEHLDTLKDEFIALVTHELRSPLTTIQANAQLLRRHVQKGNALWGDTVAQAQNQDIALLDKMIYQIGQMNKLIDEMLDVARIRGEMFQLHKKEHVDMVALVQCVAEQYTSQSHDILFHANESPILGTYDEDRIEQVLNNLLSNAIKYSPEGKSIVVSVIREPEKPDEVVVAVHDEGLGIPEKDQEHIFERFYRSDDSQREKPHGLGLGLYIAHEIISLHDGQIWLESAPGKGTTFYFSVPIQKS